MQSGLFLDVVIAEGPTVFQLFTSEDQPLLIWGNAFLVLDFWFDVFDGVGGLNLERDGFTCKRFNEDLHTTSEPED